MLSIVAMPCLSGAVTGMFRVMILCLLRHLAGVISDSQDIISNGDFLRPVVLQIFPVMRLNELLQNIGTEFRALIEFPL